MRDYSDPQYKAARLTALKRDGKKCRICGSKSKVVSHHLDGWDKFPALRCEPKNLITICKKHHEQFHSIYGKGGNTIYQFDQFLNFYCHTTLVEIMNKPIRKRK